MSERLTLQEYSEKIRDNHISVFNYNKKIVGIRYKYMDDTNSEVNYDIAISVLKQDEELYNKIKKGGYPQETLILKQGTFTETKDDGAGNVSETDMQQGSYFVTEEEERTGVPINSINCTDVAEAKSLYNKYFGYGDYQDLEYVASFDNGDRRFFGFKHTKTGEEDACFEENLVEFLSKGNTVDGLSLNEDGTINIKEAPVLNITTETENTVDEDEIELLTIDDDYDDEDENDDDTYAAINIGDNDIGIVDTDTGIVDNEDDNYDDIMAEDDYEDNLYDEDRRDGIGFEEYNPKTDEYDYFDFENLESSLDYGLESLDLLGIHKDSSYSDVDEVDSEDANFSIILNERLLHPDESTNAQYLAEYKRYYLWRTRNMWDNIAAKKLIEGDGFVLKDQLTEQYRKRKKQALDDIRDESGNHQWVYAGLIYVGINKPVLFKEFNSYGHIATTHQETRFEKDANGKIIRDINGKPLKKAYKGLPGASISGVPCRFRDRCKMLHLVWDVAQEPIDDDYIYNTLANMAPWQIHNELMNKRPYIIGMGENCTSQFFEMPTWMLSLLKKIQSSMFRDIKELVASYRSDKNNGTTIVQDNIASFGLLDEVVNAAWLYELGAWGGHEYREGCVESLPHWLMSSYQSLREKNLYIPNSMVMAIRDLLMGWYPQAYTLSAGLRLPKVSFENVKDKISYVVYDLYVKNAVFNAAPFDELMSLIYQNNKKAIRVFSDELALAVATYKADPNNYTIFAKSTGLSEVVLDKMFEVNTDRLPNIFKYLYYTLVYKITGAFRYGTNKKPTELDSENKPVIYSYEGGTNGRKSDKPNSNSLWYKYKKLEQHIKDLESKGFDIESVEKLLGIVELLYSERFYMQDRALYPSLSVVDNLLGYSTLGISKFSPTWLEDLQNERATYEQSGVANTIRDYFNKYGTCIVSPDSKYILSSLDIITKLPISSNRDKVDYTFTQQVVDNGDLFTNPDYVTKVVGGSLNMKGTTYLLDGVPSLTPINEIPYNEIGTVYPIAAWVVMGGKYPALTGLTHYRYKYDPNSGGNFIGCAVKHIEQRPAGIHTPSWREQCAIFKDLGKLNQDVGDDVRVTFTLNSTIGAEDEQRLKKKAELLGCSTDDSTYSYILDDEVAKGHEENILKLMFANFDSNKKYDNITTERYIYTGYINSIVSIKEINTNPYKIKTLVERNESEAGNKLLHMDNSTWELVFKVSKDDFIKSKKNYVSSAFAHLADKVMSVKNIKCNQINLIDIDTVKVNVTCDVTCEVPMSETMQTVGYYIVENIKTVDAEPMYNDDLNDGMNAYFEGEVDTVQVAGSTDSQEVNESQNTQIPLVFSKDELADSVGQYKLAYIKQAKVNALYMTTADLSQIHLNLSLDDVKAYLQALPCFNRFLSQNITFESNSIREATEQDGDLMVLKGLACKNKIEFENLTGTERIFFVPTTLDISIKIPYNIPYGEIKSWLIERMYFTDMDSIVVEKGNNKITVEDMKDCIKAVPNKFNLLLPSGRQIPFSDFGYRVIEHYLKTGELNKYNIGFMVKAYEDVWGIKTGLDWYKDKAKETRMDTVLTDEYETAIKWYLQNPKDTDVADRGETALNRLCYSKRMKKYLDIILDEYKKSNP